MGIVLPPPIWLQLTCSSLFWGHQLKALSFFGFVAAIRVINSNVKTSEVNNMSLGMQTGSPRKMAFVLHQKHKHFCGWQEKHTSVVPCGVFARCHSGKGTISKSRKDAQSLETSLIKPVKKLLWRSAERTGGHCFSCWQQDWGWTAAFHVWKTIRKLRLRFHNLLIMRKIKRAFGISTLTGLKGKWDLKKLLRKPSSRQDKHIPGDQSD